MQWNNTDNGKNFVSWEEKSLASIQYRDLRKFLNFHNMNKREREKEREIYIYNI